MQKTCIFGGSGATHQPTTYKATQRTVVKPMLSPCIKMKGHFPAASLQVWRGWVGIANAGSLPWTLTEGVIASLSQLSTPYRTCPISNPSDIFTMLLLQGCKGGQRGRAVLTLLPTPASLLSGQRWLPLPSAVMVKSAFGSEPASTAGNCAASPAQRGRLLAPKRLHLRSGPCGCSSASAWELVLLKGSPVPAVEQGWIPFFCNFCGFPGEIRPILGLVYPTLRMGYIAVVLMQNLYANLHSFSPIAGRCHPQYHLKGNLCSFSTMPAQVTTLLIGIQK